jgi:hypothetical protein
MLDWSQTLPWWLGGRRGKDDRKKNTMAPLIKIFSSSCFSMKGILNGGYKEVNQIIKPLEAFIISLLYIQVLKVNRKKC